MSSTLSVERSNPSVMIVEDEPLIALALEEEFIKAIFLVSGPFRTCADALSALNAELPDVAVLDAVLEDGPCHDLALELKRRSVPFLICSGMSLDVDRAQGAGGGTAPGQAIALSRDRAARAGPAAEIGRYRAIFSRPGRTLLEPGHLNG